MNYARFCHVLNANLWFINGCVWLFYAHVPVMAIGSIVAMVLSVYLARME